MLETIVERLAELLKQERIEYANPEALTKECSSLTDIELRTLILRLDAVHRLLVSIRQRRLAQTRGR
jgi:hypothetical protein